MSKLSPTRLHWQWYRDLFSITILRYLVVWFSIVPIIISIYRNLPDELQIRVSQVTYFMDLDLEIILPFNWQLLWISSFFYVIALTLYYIFCPKFIKLYPSFAHYKEHLHSPRWIVWEAEELINDEMALPKLYDRLSKKKYFRTTDPNEAKGEVIVKENQTEITFTYDGVDNTLSFPPLGVSENVILSQERDIFWEIFGRYSQSRKFFRLLIIGILSISALLFAIALSQHVFRGLEYTWDFIVSIYGSICYCCCCLPFFQTSGMLF